LETPNVPSREPDLSGPAAGAPTSVTARLMRHAITVVLALVACIWLYSYFGPDGLLTIAKVAVGLGLVIFIHELGHFIVAKSCDVHVETFSIGFGPSIPGCSFQCGETLYKIAWFPLGGYVKMVGEGAEDDEHDEDPRSFKNKPVWQRMAIISAGVVMNVLLGAAIFVFVYMTHGAEQLTGKIGKVDSGSPAWKHGLIGGSRIVQINDIRDPYWMEDVMPEIMHTRSGKTVRISFEPPHDRGKTVTVEVEPLRDKDDLKPTLGIVSGSSLRLINKPHAIWLNGPYVTTSAAAQASPPLEFGDVIVGASNPDNAGQVTSLPENDSAELSRRLQEMTGKPIVLQVRRAADLINVTVPPAYYYTLGTRMRMGHITAVRKGSPAEQADVQPRDLAAGLEGDIIKEVEVATKDGGRIRFVSSPQDAKPGPGVSIKELDPLRLPFDLQQWAAQSAADRSVLLTVLRPVKHAAREKVVLRLTWDEHWRFDGDVPFNPNSPWSIPSLGLAYRVETVVDAVLPHSPAEKAGIREGDVVKAIRFQLPGPKPGEEKATNWVDLEYDQWAHYFWLLQEQDFKEVALKVEREGQVQELTLVPEPDLNWPRADRGLRFQADTVLVKADGVAQAIAMGTRDTTNSIKQIYQTLLAIMTGRISVKGVAGPIGIAEIAYAKASLDIYSLLLLLARISINLAVINFLPIPILDGGHMVFLLYELVRGKAASEQVRVAATYLGLAVIVSLMVFVIYLDLSRHFRDSG
jgi:regulator of sigma E protease